MNDYTDNHEHIDELLDDLVEHDAETRVRELHELEAVIESGDWIVVPFYHWWTEDPAGWLRNGAFENLSLAARGLLLTILLAYADCDGLLRMDDLRAMRDVRAGHVHYAALFEANFIDFVSDKPVPISRRTPAA